MSALESILIAEEKVAGLQSQLRTVESVLESAEQIAVTGEKTGRCLRRLLRVLLVLSVVAVVVMIAKKLMGGRCSTDEEAVTDSGSTPETAHSDLDDANPVGNEDAS